MGQSLKNNNVDVQDSVAKRHIDLSNISVRNISKLYAQTMLKKGGSLGMKLLLRPHPKPDSMQQKNCKNHSNR